MGVTSNHPHITMESLSAGRDAWIVEPRPFEEDSVPSVAGWSLTMAKALCRRIP